MKTYHDDESPIPHTNLTTRDVKRWLQHGPYAWPGGYPMFFITTDGAALSFHTVRKNWLNVCWSIKYKCNDGWRVCAVDVNYENDDLYDDHTGEPIESAYGDD